MKFAIVKELRLDAFLTRAERIFKTNEIGPLLYTPPYSPDSQSFEDFLAPAKRSVVFSWDGNTRTMAETTRLLLYGFFGKREAKDMLGVKR